MQFEAHALWQGRPLHTALAGTCLFPSWKRQLPIPSRKSMSNAWPFIHCYLPSWPHLPMPALISHLHSLEHT